MITKIFKRLSVSAIITCFFLSFSANLFVLFTRSGGYFYDQIFSQAFIFSLNIILIIILVSFSQARRFNLRFGASHLISFPLCIILFGQGHYLNPQKLIIAFSLLFATNIMSKEISKIDPIKDFFALGLIFSTITYLNFSLSLFFLSIGLVIIYISKKKEALISLLIGVVAASSILITISHAFTGQIFYIPPEILEKNFFTPFNKENSELIWSFTAFIAVIISIVLKQSKFKKSRYNDLGNGENFMLFWLIISFIFRAFELYQDKSLWLLSYIPTAFFIGKFFEVIKNDRNREIFFFSLFFVGVISNLYRNKIILI